jgi:RNA polymerase sigma-70 factor (ECF subfamily)
MPAAASDTIDWAGGDARFCTTQWTVVLAAGGDGPQQAEALDLFCRAYWYPIYAFIRRHGAGPDDARDLTQAFFAQLLEKEWLSAVERRDTRFSTLLLTIVKRFVATHRRDASTLKRGGGATVLSLDLAHAEAWFGAEPTTDETPEKTFARRWALAVMEAAHAQLKARTAAAGKAAHFAALSPYLAREPQPGDYEALEATLGINANAIAAAVHRLRQQYRDALREELGAGSVPNSEVEADLRHLADALA